MDYEIVDQAIREGNLWRAKEILRGRIASSVFDRQLLKRYGDVLLAMGDLVEAGCMLFFSGARDTKYNEAIRLFLSRYPRDNPKLFMSSMPKMIRRQQHLAEFIASAEFATHGWTDLTLASIRPVPIRIKTSRSYRQKLKARAEAVLVFTFFICFIALPLIVGWSTMVGYIWSKF